MDLVRSIVGDDPPRPSSRRVRVIKNTKMATPSPGEVNICVGDLGTLFGPMPYPHPERPGVASKVYRLNRDAGGFIYINRVWIGDFVEEI